MARFADIFLDVTKDGHKIPKENYLPQGKYPIIDQGQEYIAGYSDESAGLYKDVPAIIFGDHTRIIKYVDTPCFLGADGVKLLKAKDTDANYKYLYYALSHARIPNTGYNRHFKWLKEVDIRLPNKNEQQCIVKILDKLSDLISLRKQQLAKLDELVKARFVEMFGDPIGNPLKWDTPMLSNCLENIGLSNRDVIDLADTTTRKTMGKVISDIITPEKFLKLDIAAYSIAPLSYADSSDTYIFEFFTKVKGEKFTLRFKKEHFTSNNTEVKCMITDLNRGNLKLYTFSGSLGILPQSVYKYLNLSGQEHIEVTLRPDQVVAGRTGNGSIILASIEPEYSWKCLYIKVALYTPLEVTL